MKQLPFTGNHGQDAIHLAETLERNGHESRAYITKYIMEHYAGKTKFDLDDVLRIQLTYLEHNNKKNQKSGWRKDKNIQKPDPIYIGMYLTTMLPVSIKRVDAKQFQLNFGHSTKSKNSTPAFRTNYDYPHAKYGLLTWYQTCEGVYPLSTLNEYTFGVIAGVLFQTITNDFRKV